MVNKGRFVDEDGILSYRNPRVPRGAPIREGEVLPGHRYLYQRERYETRSPKWWASVKAEKLIRSFRELGIPMPRVYVIANYEEAKRPVVLWMAHDDEPKPITVAEALGLEVPDPPMLKEKLSRRERMLQMIDDQLDALHEIILSPELPVADGTPPAEAARIESHNRNLRDQKIRAGNSLRSLIRDLEACGLTLDPKGEAVGVDEVVAGVALKAMHGNENAARLFLETEGVIDSRGREPTQVNIGLNVAMLDAAKQLDADEAMEIRKSLMIELSQPKKMR